MLLFIITFPLFSIVSTFPLWGSGGYFPLWGLGGIQAQTPSWQWSKTEGGDLNTINNDNIDDEVLKIIPAIENDGSFIVVSRVMQTSLSSYAYYFDSVLVAKQNLSPSVANSTIVIAKHDCDGNAVIVKQIEDIAFYNHLSSEGFQDIVQINNKYYLFANVTNVVNDSALIIDSVYYTSSGTKGSMFIVLDQYLKVDSVRINTMTTSQNFVNTGPNMNGVRVGPDKNIYFIAAVRDSAKYLSDDPAIFYRGISFAKMDTFGNILDMHQLTDTMDIFDGFLCDVEDLYIGNDFYLISGYVWKNRVINSITLNVVNQYYNGFLMKIDKSTHTTIWYKQPEQYSSFPSLNSITQARENFIMLRGNAKKVLFPNMGTIYDGDTIISQFNGSNYPFPINIDPNSGDKLNWSYPDGNAMSINDVIVEDSMLYLNYKFRNMYWQNINIATPALDWNTSSELQHNGIFKYNLNTGVVDTLTTYKFTHFELSSVNSKTNTMAKLGDNIIVGGNVGALAYIGNDTIEDLGGTGSSLFFAKFGTSQCVFCDSVVANFSYQIDTFNLSFSNSSSNADDYTWFIDDSIILANTATSYNFIGIGAHTICLIAENTCSTDTFCQTINISCQAPTSLITANQSGYDITLSNNSQNANSYSINWGDGTINTNLEHSYTSAGNYEICLVSTNFCGTDTACINVEIITGVEEQYSNGFVVAMYPNPAQEELNVSWQNIENQQKTIKIYNLYGQEMQSINVENKLHKTQKLSLKNYAKGIYFVVLEVEGTKVWSAKLVVE